MKLTSAEIKKRDEEIVRRAQKGAGLKALAKEYQYSKSWIYKILDKKGFWKARRRRSIVKRLSNYIESNGRWPCYLIKAEWKTCRDQNCYHIRRGRECGAHNRHLTKTGGSP